MEKFITLKSTPKNNQLVGQTVRINRDAAEVIGNLMRKTGMSAKNIVSEIIIQAADYIAIDKSDDGDKEADNE